MLGRCCFSGEKHSAPGGDTALPCCCLPVVDIEVRGARVRVRVRVRGARVKVRVRVLGWG